MENQINIHIEDLLQQEKALSGQMHDRAIKAEHKLLEVSKEQDYLYHVIAEAIELLRECIKNDDLWCNKEQKLKIVVFIATHEEKTGI